MFDSVLSHYKLPKLEAEENRDDEQDLRRISKRKEEKVRPQHVPKMLDEMKKGKNVIRQKFTVSSLKDRKTTLNH